MVFGQFRSVIRQTSTKVRTIDYIDTFTFPFTLFVDEILLCHKMFCYLPHPPPSSNLLQVVQSYRRLLLMLDKNNLPQDFDPPPWMPKLVSRYIDFELCFNFEEWEKRSSHFLETENISKTTVVSKQLNVIHYIQSTSIFFDRFYSILSGLFAKEGIHQMVFSTISMVQISYWYIAVLWVIFSPGTGTSANWRARQSGCPIHKINRSNFHPKGMITRLF